MKTFKEGDRVNHPNHGAGTVAIPHDGTAWSTVEFDSGDRLMTDNYWLSPEPKFKIGDRVSHFFHRDGTVEEIQANGLLWINIGGNRGYFALEDQIEHAVPEPTYHICINEITGAAHVPGSLTAKEVANYIADNVDWRVAVEIKITKEGN